MKFLITFFIPIFIFAHSLSVTASYEEEELFIESFFGDGNPCKDCFFEIIKNDNEIYSNKLGNDGVFEQNIKLLPPFEVIIDGGMGHSADVKVDGNEITKETVTSQNSTTMQNIDESKIREIIRSELIKQNSKIEVMIEKNKSNFEKMIVGLGYILGIFGLWQLFIRNQEK